MAITSTKKSKKKSALSIREYRSAIAKLKRAGLISQNIDARSHKPTRYMREQIAKFRDVIDGRATTVRAPSKKAAREYSGIRPTKFDRIVVMKSDGDRARYIDGEIRVTRTGYYDGVKKFNQIIRPQNPDEIPSLPRDTVTKIYRYGMPFRRGKSIRRIFADSIDEIKRLMISYDPASGGRFDDWQKYIEILEFDRGDTEDDEFEIDAEHFDEEEGEKAFERRRKAKAQPRDKKGRFTRKK